MISGGFLKSIFDFLSTVLMTVKPSKAIVSRCSSSQHLTKGPPADAEGKSVRVVEEVRNAVLVPNIDVNYRSHFTYISKQCCNILCNLKTVRENISEEKNALSFKSSVVSKKDYSPTQQCQLIRKISLHFEG